MKKISAFILAILVLLCCASCEREDEPVPGLKEADSTFEGKFTCVANGVVMGDEVSVKVCEEYRDRLGEYVNVKMPNLDSYAIYGQCELEVTVSRIEQTVPATVHASEVVILKSASTDDLSAYYGHGPFTIPALSEIVLPSIFPDFEELEDKLQLREYKYYVAGALRVIAINDDTVWLSKIYSRSVNVAITGVKKADFEVGDHIYFESPRYYTLEIGHIETEYNFYDMVKFEDVSSLRVIDSSEELVNIYKGVYSVDKPVIYLYPENDTECTVRVDIDGVLTCTYPEHGDNGWQSFIARPDGTLVFPNGREYYCLYWEGLWSFRADLSKGFCVKGSDTAEFLEWALDEIGLTPREANEFIVYWLPRLRQNPYNLISFQGHEYSDSARLEIAPLPDSLLRVYMIAKPLDAYVEIEPQEFEDFAREGFTVVEWGGSIVE